jgi:hypothetical protein
MDRLISKVDDESAFSKKGKLVHIFQTGTPQTQAVTSMNFSEKDSEDHVSLTFNDSSSVQMLNIA